jgi:hypothetical protein
MGIVDNIGQFINIHDTQGAGPGFEVGACLSGRPFLTSAVSALLMARPRPPRFREPRFYYQVSLRNVPECARLKKCRYRAPGTVQTSGTERYPKVGVRLLRGTASP